MSPRYLLKNLMPSVLGYPKGWSSKWPGLEITVPLGSKPGLFLAAPGPFHLSLWCDSPRLFVGLDEWWDQPTYFRSSHSSLLPPLERADLSTMRFEPLSAGWWEAWAKRFLKEFDQIGLQPGLWWLLASDLRSQSSEGRREWPGPPVPGLWPPPPPPRGLKSLEDPRQAWTCFRDDVDPGELLALHPPRVAFSTGSQESRLKWWRKVARNEGIPPAVGIYLPVHERMVVLDGHLRLQAAQLEASPAPMLVLCRMWKTHYSPRRDQTNLEAGLHRFGFQQTERGMWLTNKWSRRVAGESTYHPVTVAKPYPGSWEGWKSDIETRAEGVEAEEDDDIPLLLDPFRWNQRR